MTVDADPADWARELLSPWPCETRPRPMSQPVGRVAAWAGSGAVALTGRSDGPPLVPPGGAASAALGAQIAFYALAGASTTGRGPAWHRLFGERAVLAGLSRRAPWSVGGACRAVPTADGWVALSLARADDVAAVGALVGCADVPSDDAAAWALVDGWSSHVTATEFVDRAILLGLPCGVIPPAGTWSGRDRLEPVVARQPVRVTEVGAGEPPPPEARPLVVDLSALWAGPLCTNLLGVAGARVVKVESASRLDGARFGGRRFYDLMHAGHDSVVVDVDRADDRRLVRHLLDRADVVVTASRPRAMRSLGIDVVDVCGRSPTTWVSITAYGVTQPDRVGFGDDVALAAGLVAREPGDDRPLPCGDALADPLTGMHAAVAALASFRHGGSRVLDVAMCDVVAATLAWQPSTVGAAQRRDDGWSVGGCAVTEPAARAVPGQAAPPGRDTETWRRDDARSRR